MSFGFGIGDFIALQRLAEHLYKDIYARHEAKELLALQNELATLSMSVNLLIEEVQDPGSTLARSGSERVSTINGIVADTMKSLKELEKILQSAGQGQRKGGASDKWKFMRNKTKWAIELPKIESLCARLKFHNGTLNLLLVSAGE
jgi:hypothetical protein